MLVFCQLRELLGQLLDEALWSAGLETSIFIDNPGLSDSLVGTYLFIIFL